MTIECRNCPSTVCTPLKGGGRLIKQHFSKLFKSGVEVTSNYTAVLQPIAECPKRNGTDSEVNVGAGERFEENASYDGWKSKDIGA